VPLFPTLGVLATLVVNEVLYDPAGADGGKEYVEVLNLSTAAFPLAGLELQVGDGARAGSWRTVWRASGDSLGPQALLVIGGDSVAVRTATLEASLQNGPDAVRLWQQGRSLDLLGYGAHTFPEYYEGAPAPDVSGASLARFPDGVDTEVNAADFRGATPTPGRRNAARRAFAVRLVPPAPARLWPFRPVEVLAQVRNTGIETLASGSYSVEGRLLPVRGEPYLDAVVLGPAQALTVRGASPALAPGDSTSQALSWSGELGLFRLEVLLHGADEDSTDHAASLWLRFGGGPVLIQEILFAPSAGAPEWIEVGNRDGRPHDLAGWTLADATGHPVSLRASRPLAPGERAILAADSTSAIPGLAETVLRVAVSPWPSLNNTDDDTGFADVLVLRDRTGLVQDAVTYSAAWGSERGRSLERLTADPDARGLLWAPCKDRSGSTPGRENSASAPPGWSTELVLQPNPFSPDGDGQEDLLAVAFEVPASHTGFQLALFDTSGRRRRLLAGDRLGPGPRRFVWDGNDDAGRSLETGVYVLRLELVGGPSATQLRTIGLVRR